MATARRRARFEHGAGAQAKRRLVRKKGTVGAITPPGTPSGYHLSARGATGCQCGGCSTATL